MDTRPCKESCLAWRQFCVVCRPLLVAERLESNPEILSNCSSNPRASGGKRFFVGALPAAMTALRSANRNWRSPPCPSAIR